MLPEGAYYERFEQGLGGFGIIDYGGRVLEGWPNSENRLRVAMEATDLGEEIQLLQAGATCSFDPEYLLRLYRALAGKVLKPTRQLPPVRTKRLREKPLHLRVVDQSPIPIGRISEAIKSSQERLRASHFKISPLVSDLTDLGDAIEKNTLHFIFMDCLLACADDPEAILNALKKLLTKEGIILFRELLTQGEDVEYNPLVKMHINPPLETQFLEMVDRSGLTAEFWNIQRPETVGAATRERVGILFRT